MVMFNTILDGAVVAMSSVDGLIGTGFASQYSRLHRTCVIA